MLPKVIGGPAADRGRVKALPHAAPPWAIKFGAGNVRQIILHDSDLDLVCAQRSSRLEGLATPRNAGNGCTPDSSSPIRIAHVCFSGEIPMNPRFTLPLATMAALLAAAALPALGQLYQPVGPGSVSDVTGAALIPDFSGIWARFSLPGFEPPLEGPGPITNTWRIPNGLVGDYTNAILKPHAAEAVKKHGEMELRGALAPNPRNQCWPRGVPFAFSNVGIQIIQQPDRITILSADDHEVRRVRLNAVHPARVTPTWYGDSVGHYEGDMLVVDTVGIKIGPFSMVDWYGTPYTEALHVVERYRLLDYEAAKAAEVTGSKGQFPISQHRPGPCTQHRL
jgi:hypothetical protein